MKTFNLPDLGEGLPDAEIVEWLVEEGERVEVDQPLVSMETAKAVVEVPSPFAGKLAKQHGKAGDVIETGEPLADFEVDEDKTAEQEQQDDNGKKGEKKDKAPGKEEKAGRGDSGTVVGQMESSDRVVKERAGTAGGVKAVPAVRALARKLNVDLSRVTPTGRDGQVTAKDVKQYAEKMEDLGPMEQVKGTRRAMARAMAQSHVEIVPTTLCDDADIGAWKDGQDITIRLIRAIVKACEAEPSLNAWFDGDKVARRIHDQIDIGIAVDTKDGLFVPALRDVAGKDDKELRKALDELRQGVEERSIPPEELRDYTFMLSNFGVFAGRYATPVINPPCVAILAAGKGRDAVVAKDGKPAVSRVMPLSLTFDHRAATGGEAARFLKVLLSELEKPE